MNIRINSLAELSDFAAKFAKNLRAPQAVLLNGELGTGKTEFVRAVIRHLCGMDTIVQSPTFNMVQIYQSPIGQIAHFDLYRLNSPDELEELGLAEYLLDSIVFIEWPDMARDFIKNAIVINISNNPDGSRDIDVIS